MGSESPKYLVIHQIFFTKYVYFIFFAWSKVGLVQKILKILGKVAWFQYKTAPQKIKLFHRKIKTKISLKRDSPNILVVRIPWMSYKVQNINKSTGLTRYSCLKQYFCCHFASTYQVWSALETSLILGTTLTQHFLTFWLWQKGVISFVRKVFLLVGPLNFFFFRCTLG